MGFGLRRSALACAVLVVGLVAVGVGSAGPRTPISIPATFQAFPGPAAVSYGENIAYRATLSNGSGSTLTHVIFRQTFPVGASASGPVDSSCPAGASRTILNADGSPKWWACDFGQVSAGVNPVVVVVWRVPSSSATANCTTGCFSTTGFWSVKEGLNDTTDPNDQFGLNTVTATLLSTGDNASETLKAGGYETGSASCDDPAAGGRTKQKLSLQNPVGTPSAFPRSRSRPKARISATSRRLPRPRTTHSTPRCASRSSARPARTPQIRAPTRSSSHPRPRSRSRTSSAC